LPAVWAERDIGKPAIVVGVVQVHSVTETVVGEDVEAFGENSTYADTQRDVSDVIEHASTIGIAGRITANGVPNGSPVRTELRARQC
jgi:hypothetical protein